MKRENVKVGLTVADRHSMIQDLLQTDLFKDELYRAYDALSFNENPENLVQAVFMAMLKRPLMLCPLDDYELESSHFTTFFGVIGVRTHYTNPYINDLYYLHEVSHAATMDYSGIDSIQEFHRRTGLNELFAATLTEVYVYTLYPILRAKTFDFPIWRDTYARYLPDVETRFSNDVRFSNDDLMMPSGFEDKAFLKWCTVRYDAIQHPDYLNLTEMQIAAYAAQNAAWTQVWARSWRGVCVEMASYLECAQGLRVQDSVKAHLAWVFEENMRENDVTPFQIEAEAFLIVHKDTKRRMGNIALFPASLNQS